MNKVEISESRMVLHEERRYYTIYIKFKAPINLEHLSEKNPNIEYDSQIGVDDKINPKTGNKYREGHDFQAKIRTPLGTILLWRTGARIPKLPKNRGDELTVTMLERYLKKILNGEQRSFKQWLKEDMKEFAKEIGVIE